MVGWTREGRCQLAARRGPASPRPPDGAQCGQLSEPEPRGPDFRESETGERGRELHGDDGGKQFGVQQFQQ